MSAPTFLGLDLGTSGCRVCVIDDTETVLASINEVFPPTSINGARHEQNPADWLVALHRCLQQLAELYPLNSIRRIAVDGTSGTVLTLDPNNHPLGPALMYNDARATEQADALTHIAPQQSAVHSATSSLAKRLWLQQHTAHKGQRHIHQADWLNEVLCGQPCPSDENNCLKLGYDPIQRRWPAWLATTGIDIQTLPKVVEPGSPIGTIAAQWVKTYGFDKHAQIVAGTTDSIASLIATGANAMGDAVTALGSTLAIKLISDQPLFHPSYGIYSHRLGHRWLVGGASNSGGSCLLQHFSTEQLQAMTPKLLTNRSTELDYYPLPRPGERFPINDPNYLPRISPRPASDVTFFQALLEGISQVESLAYRRLAELGAAPIKTLRTTGGGSQNPAWQQIRSLALKVPMPPCDSTEAAFGSARLARRGVS